MASASTRMMSSCGPCRALAVRWPLDATVRRSPQDGDGATRHGPGTLRRRAVAVVRAVAGYDHLAALFGNRVAAKAVAPALDVSDRGRREMHRATQGGSVAVAF